MKRIMEYKKRFLFAVVFDCVFLAAAAFFYLDRQAQGELIETLTGERDSALSTVTEKEEQIKSMQSKLALFTQGGQQVDADAERLKKIIDEKDAEISRLKLAMENNQNQRRRGRDNQEGRQNNMANVRQRMEDRMQQLREQNPERYNQIMADREALRKRMEDRISKRNQYLSNINLARLTTEQRQVVGDYQELLKANDEIRANMQEGNGMESFREMMNNQRQINEMSTQIRDILIEQYAGSISSTSGAQVAEEIRSIIDVTSSNGPGGFGPGRGGFRGGPGGM